MAQPSPNSAASNVKRIMLVDDHSIVREGFARIINDEDDMEVCHQVGSAKEVLSAISKHRPDLIVVDMCLDDTPGLELIKDIRAVHSKLCVLGLSMYDETLYAERAVRAGANGYVMKRSSPETVIEAIRTVLQGRLWVGPSVSDRMMRGMLGRKPSELSNLESLSDREFEVFQLIGQGMKSREIAEKLAISPKTVDTYRMHLKQKLQLENGSELARYAMHWVVDQGKARNG